MSEHSATANADLWLADGAAEHLVLRWREQTPRYLSLFAGAVERLDFRVGSLDVTFAVGPEWGHVMGLQGGIVASMLDRVMAQCVIVCSALADSPPALELKVSYLEPAPPGSFRARSDIAHRGGWALFLRSELRDGRGRMVAMATSTSRLVVRRKDAEL